MRTQEEARRPVLVVKDQYGGPQNRHQQTGTTCTYRASRRQFEDRFQALARRTFDAAFECPVRKEGAEVDAALADALRVLLGFSPQEGTRRWQPLVHPDDHAAVATHIQRVLGGRRALCVFRGLAPDAPARWFGALMRPVWDASGRHISHVYGLVQDYSARLETAPLCIEADAVHLASPHPASPHPALPHPALPHPALQHCVCPDGF